MTHSFSFRERLTPDSMAAAFLALLPFFYFLPAVRGALVISPDDGIIFNVPLRVATANLIRAGYAPLWNPYIFSGMPLHAAAQAGVLFPLNWFYLFFSPPVATNLMMLSTYSLAALGAYLFARRAGANIAGAMLTSIVWQASAFLVGQIGHTNILQTAAMLPWLLWAIDGYGSTGKRSRGLLLAVIVALQVFTGHQQTLCYALLLAAAYAVGMSRVNHPSDRSRTAYLWSLVLIAAGLALAAVQILPTAELLRNSMRADASYDFITSFSLPPRFLWTFFAPYIMGGGDGGLFRSPYVGPDFYGEFAAYVGSASIALAGMAFVLKRDARTKFWTVVVFAGLLLALGRYVPFHFYKLIYFIPVLNLFRVPARHLMEVEFALAVLAGQGVTAIMEGRDTTKISRSLLMIGGIVVALTCLAVTVGRPAAFHLGRTASVTILRAPELFLPVVVAVLSVGVLWIFAKRRQRWTVFLLLTVVALDLALWGQSSGWRSSSPTRASVVWNEPPTTQPLRAHDSEANLAGPYRILTEDQRFDPAIGLSPATPGRGWEPFLQPDIHMLYARENAAGYDGFGLARYSRLAGDMKVWGELTDPARTLGSDSRELDLLNVRYLFARGTAKLANAPVASPLDKNTPASLPLDFPTATQVNGGERFGAEEISLSVKVGQRLLFNIPPIRVDRIALLTNLSWSESVTDGTVVARLQLTGQDGKKFDFALRAGEHTSEWAHDRADISARIKHKGAPVGTSYQIEDAQGKYEGHTYVSSFELPAGTLISSGEIVVASIKTAPELELSLSRIAFADTDRSFALRREWVKKEIAPNAKGKQIGPLEKEQPPPTQDSAQRWQPVAQVGNVLVFENKHALPRAWLASGELVVTEEQQLEIIRTGKTPDGEMWNPLNKGLVESATGIQFGKETEAGQAEVIALEPNRVELKTQSNNPALLVLSANHYPGWRAYVDGQPAEVARVDYNLRGVAVPAGNHLVNFLYRPKSVLLGLMISLLTLAGLLLWWSRAR